MRKIYASPQEKWYQMNCQLRSALAILKLEAGCADCGYNKHPEALDFDHVRGEKSFAIATGRNYSLSRLLDEIDKCDVVCANCHRVRTADRRTS